MPARSDGRRTLSLASSRAAIGEVFDPRAASRREKRYELAGLLRASAGFFAALTGD